MKSEYLPNNVVSHFLAQLVLVGLRRPNLSIEKLLNRILNPRVEILKCWLCVDVGEALLAKHVEVALRLHLEDDFVEELGIVD